MTRYAGDDRLVPLLTRGQVLKARSLVFVGAKQALVQAWPPAKAPPKPPNRPHRGAGRRGGKKA